MIFLPLSVESGMDILLRDECAKWSGFGARLIMEHLEALSDDTGNHVEFDRVAIRCEWSEFETIEEAARCWGITPKQLRDATTVLKHDSSNVVVVQDF